MGITLDISTGRVDLGETKRFDVTPKNSSDGSPLAPTTLTAVFTPAQGEPTTYELGDFTPSEGTYTLYHTFGVIGKWLIEVTAVDALGHRGVERGSVIVR